MLVVCDLCQVYVRLLRLASTCIVIVAVHRIVADALVAIFAETTVPSLLLPKQIGSLTLPTCVMPGPYVNACQPDLEWRGRLRPLAKETGTQQ